MPRAAEIDEIIQTNLNAMIAEAGGDDEALLRMATRELTYCVRYRDLVEEVRDMTAARLRRRGVPMTQIANIAGVSDSYLSRRLIRNGATRKVVRGLAAIVVGTLLLVPDTVEDDGEAVAARLHQAVVTYQVVP